MIVTLLIGGLLIGGLVLLVFGLRGRRVDDHPFCRKCRYDLSGLGERPETCPECGVDLAAHAAVRIGRRRTRPLMIAPGVLLLLLTLGGGAFIGVQNARGFDWNTIKPTWTLERELKGGTGNASAAACAELVRRLDNDRLSDERVIAINDYLLTQHADPNAGWPGAFSLFIERSYQRGDLGEDRFIEYLQTAVTMATSAFARDLSRYDDETPVGIRHRNYRLHYDIYTRRYVPGEKPTQFALVYHIVAILEDGVVIKDIARYMGSSSLSTREGSAYLNLNLGLRPGEHSLVLRAQFSLLRESDHAAPLAKWTLDLPLNVAVVPEGAELVVLRPDPRLEEEIRRSITIDLVNDRVRIGTMTYSYGDSGGFIGILNPPVDVAFDVFGRFHGEERHLCTRYMKAGLVGMRSGVLDPSNPVTDLFPSAESIDIIFRANPRVAEQTTDITEIWDGEIVFEDVPLPERE